MSLNDAQNMNKQSYKLNKMDIEDRFYNSSAQVSAIFQHSFDQENERFNMHIIRDIITIFIV